MQMTILSYIAIAIYNNQASIIMCQHIVAVHLVVVVVIVATVDCLSSVFYQVKVLDGMLWRRHVDHLQHVTEHEPAVPSDTSNSESSDELTVLPDTTTSEP